MITYEKKTAILKEIAFLNNYPGIRSIVLVGSTVLGHDDEGSDTDIVVVSDKADSDDTEDKSFQFREALRDRFEAEDNLVKANYNLFSAKQIEHLFEVGSPYANSIRQGMILKDDGLIAGLIKDGRYPLKPTMEHYVESLKLILYQLYLSPIDQLEREIKEYHTPGSYCEEECQGHYPGDFLSIGIFRMLYLTLPLRGYMPLSKKEAMRYAVEIYGELAVTALGKALEILRQQKWAITADEDEYRIIKLFAVELFQDCMRLLDLPNNNEVKAILVSAAKVLRIISENEKRTEK